MNPVPVLVVSPDARLRSRLCEILTSGGYRPLPAASLDEVLHEHGREMFEIVVWAPGDSEAGDSATPDRVVSGCRFFRSQRVTSEVPLIVIADSAGPAFLDASLDAGADDFLAQPFDDDEILLRLRVALRSKSAQVNLWRTGNFYLDLFSAMGATVTTPFHIDEDLARILSHALDAAEAPRGRLLLFDPHRNRMEVRAAAGLAIGDTAGAGEEVPEGAPPPGVIRVPLVGHGEPLGMIEIDRRGEPPLSAGRERLLMAVAAQAAIFVVNARLNREVRRMFLDIIVSLAGAVDAKDEYTHGHTVRVARVSLLLAHDQGMSLNEREALLLAALLHDVGKIGVPDSVLKKPSRLDEAERNVMREHPVIGAQMLRHIRPLREALPGIRHHHEHWDGTGYPDHLAGDAIPGSARIILVADAFDALTSDRVYRAGVPIDRALEIMREFSGIQFDPGQFASLEKLCREGAILAEDCRGVPDLFELLRSGA